MMAAMKIHLPATAGLALALLAGLASAVVTRQSSLAGSAAEALHSSEASAAAALAQHGARGTAAGGSSKITPSLKPASDHAHQVDYVHDVSPHPKDKSKFGYPYPLVQDTSDYDKDYVKDENDDTGEWKAQMDYDTLRIRIEKLKTRVDEAKAKEASEKKSLDAVTAKEAAAEAESEAAEKAAISAQKSQDDSTKHLHEIEGKEGSQQLGGKVAKQVAEVNKQIDNVEKCQEELEKAQAELKTLMKMKEKREQALEKEKRAAGVNKEEAEEKAQAARESKYEALDDKIVAKLKDEEKDYHKSVDEFKLSEAEMLKTQAEFDKVAGQLRQNRRNADPEGGVYPSEPVQKSAAVSPHPCLPVIAAVFSIAASCKALAA